MNPVLYIELSCYESVLSHPPIESGTNNTLAYRKPYVFYMGRVYRHNIQDLSHTIHRVLETTRPSLVAYNESVFKPTSSNALSGKGYRPIGYVAQSTL